MKTKFLFTKLFSFLCLVLSLGFVSCGGDDDDLPPPPPQEKVDFVASPVQGLVPLEVVFNNRSDDDFVSWHWDFGDGGSSSFENPSYTYDSSGQYTVVLTVIDVTGKSHEKKRENYIIATGAQPPYSGFEVNQTTGLAWETKFQFTNKSSGVIDEYYWDFGDGGSSTLENPNHTYTQFGKYTVKLRVSGPGGDRTSELNLKVDEVLHIYEDKVGPFWPVKISGGDCDFAGNGPDVILRAEVKEPDFLEIYDHVYVDISMEARETKSNWTTAYSTWRYTLRNLPDGIKVKDVITSNSEEFIYTDNDHAYDYDPFYSFDDDLCLFEVMGDTSGDDICGSTSIKTHVLLRFLKCEVKVGPY